MSEESQEFDQQLREELEEQRIMSNNVNCPYCKKIDLMGIRL